MMPSNCAVCQSVPAAAQGGGSSPNESIDCPVCGRWLSITPDAKLSIDGTQRPVQGLQIDATSERLSGESFRREPRPQAWPPSNLRSAARKPIVARNAVAIALCAAVGMAAVARREDVVRLLPGSQRLFAAIGLPVNLRGLDLRNVHSKLLDDGSQRVLAIEGEVANERPRNGKIPDLSISVRSKDGRVLYSWTNPPPQTTIGAGETVYFRARLAAPPAEGSDIKIQFASFEANRSAKAAAPERP